MEKIGFIGIGIMGAPMAGHLLDAGYEVFTAVNRTPPSNELTSKGILVLDSRKAVAEAADIIITIVPDTPQVDEVLFGEGGVAEGLSAGKLVIDMSSISPIETKVFADKIKALGWTPRHTGREAVIKTVAWYRDNEWWWRKIKSGEFKAYYQKQYGQRLADTES